MLYEVITFLERTPVIAIRMGAWLDPDHQMYATVDDPYLLAGQGWSAPQGFDPVNFAGTSFIHLHILIEKRNNFV